MKPVKKLAVLGLTLASVFTLAACGNSNSGASKTILMSIQQTQIPWIIQILIVQLHLMLLQT